MKRDFAESFSLSLHPILIPIYSLLFIFVLPIFEVKSLGFDFQIYIISVVFATTFLLPMLSLLFLKRLNVISSVYISDRKERNIPYLMMLSYYAITTYIFYRIEFMPTIITLVVAIAGAGSLILFLFNLRLKVSAHAMSMGGLIALLSLLMYFYELKILIPLLVAILLAGIVIASRIYLKSHTWTEIIIGFFVGILLSFSIGYYLLAPLFS